MWFDGDDPEAESADPLKVRYMDSHTKGPTTIGSDVWIGYGATILSGVRIGHGAVVGTAAVVAWNVPDYAIVVGNPARILKKRFDDVTIDRLLRLRWWDWNPDCIRRLRSYLLGDVNRFLDAITKIDESELAEYYRVDAKFDELLCVPVSPALCQF